MKYLVYLTNGEAVCDPRLDQQYEIVLWRPGLRHVIPPGLRLSFGLLWLSHYLHVFHNRDYAVLFIKKDGKIVHRSCIIPASFRWPFMAQDDLQISSTWTDPEYRGKGLATIGLKKAVLMMRKPNRRFWYITRNDNAPSITVCTKAGFVLAGRAKRTSFLGVHILGHFTIQK